MSLSPDIQPAWQGDHAFSHAAVMYSLDHFLEPKIAAEHSEWTPQQIHETARREMAISLWENRAFSKQERNREPEMKKQWEIVETSPGVSELRAQWGNQRYTVSELWDHMYQATHDKNNPATYNPAAYNGEEAKAQLAMQDAIVTGKASLFITPTSHPDGIRYFQIWEKRADGGVYTKSVDIGLDAGRNLSMKEAATFVSHLAEFNKGNGGEVLASKADYPHIMIVRGKITSEEIRTLVRAQTYSSAEVVEKSYTPSLSSSSIDVQDTFSREPILNFTREDDGFLPQIPRNDVLSTARDTLGYTTRAVVDETLTTARSASAFIKSEIRRRGNLRQDDHSKPLFLQLLEGQIDINKVLTSVKQMKRETPAVFEGKKDIKKFSGGDVSMITVATNIHLGDAILQVQQMPERQKKEVIIKREEAKKKAKERPKTFHPLITMEKWEKVKRLYKEVRRNRTERKQGREKRYEMYMTMLHVGDNKERNYRERGTRRREQKLLHMLDRLSRKLERPVFKKVKTIEQKREMGKGLASHIELPTLRKIEKTKKLVLRLSFAYVFWLLLKLSASHDQPKLTGPMKHIDSSTTKEVKQEGLMQKDPTQWILLAIIWYLAMIREGAAYQPSYHKKISGKKKQKITTKQRIPILPSQGIIFAFQ